jgi:hypothetical protein
MYVTAVNESNNEVITEKYQLDCLRLYGQVIKRTRRMPRRQEAMKDVVACEKLRRVGKQTLTRRCPNGETHPACGISSAEYIGWGSEPRELKHLSTWRKRNQPRFPE